jgi:hypothetical protein
LPLLIKEPEYETRSKDRRQENKIKHPPIGSFFLKHGVDNFHKIMFGRRFVIYLLHNFDTPKIEIFKFIFSYLVSNRLTIGSIRNFQFGGG